MGRCEVMLRGFVLPLCIACLWSVVIAQSGEDGQPNASPVDLQCVRYWWTSMWGFVVTLVALTMDVWGNGKAISMSILSNVVWTLLMSVLNPLMMVIDMLVHAIEGMEMVGNLRDALGHELVVPLFPWSKSNIKILVGADVVVNLSSEVYKEVGTSLNTFVEEAWVKDLSEAIVIGTKVEDSSQRNVELSELGKLALLRASVLPPYDQLKILRGNSTLGMIVAAAQAIGYIYAIGVRRHQGLRVSPIEAIACFLNIVVLMKVVLHNFASVAHRPLLLFLTDDEEGRFIEECEKLNSFEWKSTTRWTILRCIAKGSLSMVVIYFIINFKQSLNEQCMVPVVLFQVSLVLSMILPFLAHSVTLQIIVMPMVLFLIVVLNAIGYTWAIVVSFKYWKEEKFDVRSSNYFSQTFHKCFHI